MSNIQYREECLTDNGKPVEKQGRKARGSKAQEKSNDSLAGRNRLFQLLPAEHYKGVI